VWKSIIPFTVKYSTRIIHIIGRADWVYLVWSIHQITAKKTIPFTNISIEISGIIIKKLSTKGDGEVF